MNENGHQERQVRSRCAGGAHREQCGHWDQPARPKSQTGAGHPGSKSTAFKKRSRISSTLITALLVNLIVNPNRSPLQAHFVCETASPAIVN